MTWLNTKEAAARLGISQKKLLELADAGEVPCLRLHDGRGFVRRFRLDLAERALLRLMQEQGEEDTCGSP
jgi:excisionase family DNA binding protein